ncbi:MAG: hypothetical protein WCL43_02715 [Chlorobium sp.]|nr:MAG: hypothetical protein FDX12_01510 [Chlorobium sp.]
MTKRFFWKIYGWNNPVKRKVLERYEQAGDGKIIIDVASKSVEDLYEDFDKTAPYHKKDLDEDLVYYLTECVREIGHSEFVIRFVFERFPSEEFMQRVRTSVHKFFMYQKELELAAMKKMQRTSSVLLIIGIVILVISLWFNLFLFESRGVSFINSVIAEGLTIVAWVSMWEALATFLLNWAPHRFNIRLYMKIADATILFDHPMSYVSDAHTGSGGVPQI